MCVMGCIFQARKGFNNKPISKAYTYIQGYTIHIYIIKVEFLVAHGSLRVAIVTRVYPPDANVYMGRARFTCGRRDT